MLSSDDILKADDTGLETISVPEWGGDVCIKTMSGTERDTWELYATKELDKTSKVNIRAKLAAICLCDEKGKRLFTDQQVNALSEKSAKPLDRVYSKALEINKLSDADIEALEKN